MIPKKLEDVYTVKNVEEILNLPSKSDNLIRRVIEQVVERLIDIVVNKESETKKLDKEPKEIVYEYVMKSSHKKEDIGESLKIVELKNKITPRRLDPIYTEVSSQKKDGVILSPIKVDNIVKMSFRSNRLKHSVSLTINTQTNKVKWGKVYQRIYDTAMGGKNKNNFRLLCTSICWSVIRFGLEL